MTATSSQRRTGMGSFETISAGEAGTARVYVAGSGETDLPGVVVLHAWWGLNDDVQRFADGLADWGFAVVAPDMFGGQVAETIEDAERLSAAGDEGTADAAALAGIDSL